MRFVPWRACENCGTGAGPRLNIAGQGDERRSARTVWSRCPLMFYLRSVVEGRCKSLSLRLRPFVLLVPLALKALMKKSLLGSLVGINSALICNARAGLSIVRDRADFARGGLPERGQEKALATGVKKLTSGGSRG
jgi:hypothetical protein